MTTMEKPFDLEDGRWHEFLQKRDAGEKVEITEKMWWYWLEVLPPVFMRRKTRLVTGEEKAVAFGFAEGEEYITAFWRETGEGGMRYFCQRTTEMNTGEEW